MLFDIVKLLLAIVTAARIFGNCTKQIRTDCFVRCYKLDRDRQKGILELQYIDMIHNDL